LIYGSRAESKKIHKEKWRKRGKGENLNRDIHDKQDKYKS